MLTQSIASVAVTTGQTFDCSSKRLDFGLADPSMLLLRTAPFHEPLRTPSNLV